MRLTKLSQCAAIQRDEMSAARRGVCFLEVSAAGRGRINELQPDALALAIKFARIAIEHVA